MYRIILLFVAALLFIPASAYVIEQSHTVHFEKDDHQLIEVEIEALKQFLSSCDLYLEHSFTLEGHTDSDGTIDYNLALSDRRAETIKTFMQTQDVSGKAIEKNFHSELIPIASNSQPEGMARNRRVTIHFTAHYYDSIEEVQQHLQDGTQSIYPINSEKDELIISEAGVRIFVPAHSFVDASGASVESVAIELTESLDPMTFLAHDLQTRTSDGLLESGGMIRVKAFGPTGDELSLADGVALTIAIPDMEIQQGMEVFLTSDDGSSWEQDGSLLEPGPADESDIRRPTIKLPSFITPRFVLDQSLRPYYPAEPVSPKEPYLPTRAGFDKPFSMHYLFRKDKRIRQEEANYKYAMRIYDKRKKRFDRKLSRYDKRCAEFTNEHNTYVASLPAWEAEMSRQLKLYQDSVIPAARKNYEVRLAAIRSSHKNAIFKYDVAIDERRSEYADAMDKLGIPLGQNVDNYVFRATKLGWVNMDRFTKMKANQKQDIIARSKQSNSVEDKVFVVLNDGRSMLHLSRVGEDYILPGFPKNELAELIAYTVIDGKLHMYNELFVGKDYFEIDYRPSTISELQSMLQQKNSSLGCL